MIGLRIDGKPLLRAYSIASAHYDDELEFFSIKVPDGKLTSRLKDLAPGDSVLVGAKATGTLLPTACARTQPLSPGTGTGLAPFLSSSRPEATSASRGDRPWLPPGARLAYRSKLARSCRPTRSWATWCATSSSIIDHHPRAVQDRGRITDLIASGTLANDVGCRRSAGRTTASCWRQRADAGRLRALFEGGASARQHDGARRVRGGEGVRRVAVAGQRRSA